MRGLPTSSRPAKAETLLQDIDETFRNLRAKRVKLTWRSASSAGVPLLGFLVSHRGIKANPEKIKAIEVRRLERALPCP